MNQTYTSSVNFIPVLILQTSAFDYDMGMGDRFPILESLHELYGIMDRGCPATGPNSGAKLLRQVLFSPSFKSFVKNNSYTASDGSVLRGVFTCTHVSWAVASLACGSSIIGI